MAHLVYQQPVEVLAHLLVLMDAGEHATYLLVMRTVLEAIVKVLGFLDAHVLVTALGAAKMVVVVAVTVQPVHQAAIMHAMVEMVLVLVVHMAVLQAALGIVQVIAQVPAKDV